MNVSRANDVCECGTLRYGRCIRCKTYQHTEHPNCENYHHAFDPRAAAEEGRTP